MIDQVALEDVPMPGDWRLGARCRTAPKELFFPTRGEDLAYVKAICRGCPVQEQCLAYALEHPQLQGVWGGLGNAERERLLGGRGASVVR